MSVHQKHPVTRKARKRYQVHFFLMCRWLWAAISVLVTEPGSSGWIVNVLKCWATLHLLSLFLIKKTYLDVRGVLTSSIHYYKPRGSFMTKDSLDIDSNYLLSMVVPILSMFSLTSLVWSLLYWDQKCLSSCLWFPLAHYFDFKLWSLSLRMHRLDLWIPWK